MASTFVLKDHQTFVKMRLQPLMLLSMHLILSRVKSHIAPDYVAILEATSPLRLVEDIRKGVNLQINSRYDGVVSVVKADNRHPLKSKIIKKGKLKSFMEAENTVLRSQDLPEVFFRNGAFFSFNVDFFEKNK